MSWTNSVVLIAPAADRDAVNALLNELGYTGDNLSIPVGGTLDTKPTHYTCHFWADEELKSLSEKFALKEDISEKLKTTKKADADALVTKIVAKSIQTSSPVQFLEEKLSELKLVSNPGVEKEPPIEEVPIINDPIVKK